jgi:Rho GTPase-activating protein 10
VSVASAGEARVLGAGGAVKEYLRTLPEPLLTWELYAAFIDAAALSDAASGAQRRSSVAGLLERLPAPNRALAQVLFLYLARLADHAHRNHMNSTNLAMIFGPLLLRPQHESVGTFCIERFLFFLFFFFHEPRHLTSCNDQRACFMVRGSPPL